MESQFGEESLWASALAARLRVLQANFADDDAAARRDFITQEIERALKGCVPEKRRALLGALADRFPCWQGSSPPVPATGAAPVTSETPADLLEKLLAIVPSLPAEERASLLARLQAAGLVSERPGGALEMAPELRKRLALEGNPPLDPDRAGKAIAMLLEMVLTLDQLVWTLWKQVAPKSPVRKEGELTRLAADYLVGSAEVSQTQLLQTCERTRKLIAGLLGAIGRAGTTYARERVQLFDPAAIETDARAEKKWNESVEFACWRKYVQLSREYGAEPAIEKAIQAAIAKTAENLIMGRPAS